MMKCKLILFLILLPLLTKSKSVRPRRPAVHNDEQNDIQHPILDQIALADTWNSPSKVISATYSGNPQTGHVDHANLVINIVPRHSKRPVEVDELASQSLANAKTAEEYVNKAIELKQKYEYTTPSSSFVKYDIYEKEKKKRVPSPSPPANQIEEPIQINVPETPGDLAKSSTEYSDYIYHPQEYTTKTTTTTTYNPGDFKDLESSNTDFTHNFASSYDPITAFSNINYENEKKLNSIFGRPSSFPTKEELYEYIEKAVAKYMSEMHLPSKFGSGNTLAAAPSAHAEIKTYYRLPNSPSASTKLISTGTHSEFFKPFKSSKASYHPTVKPFILETYTPHTIDLTVRHKKHPSAIDLASLDVGQSVSHGTSSEPVGIYRKPQKHKLHFGSQAYHDINAMTYLPNRGLIYDDHNSYSSSPNSFSPLSHPYTSSSSGSYRDLVDAGSAVSIKDEGSSSVGASISFNGHSHSEPQDLEKPGHGRFTPSLQVVNGIPVKNSYKFNMHTLNDIFDNEGERAKLSQQSDTGFSASNADWSPYGLDVINSKDHLFSPNTKHHLDTYNPKYNNNPEGHGYQEDYKYSGSADWDFNDHRGLRGSSDMFTSGSTHKVKKVVPHHSKSHGKRAQKSRIKARHARHYNQPHSRDLERELAPPPPK